MLSPIGRSLISLAIIQSAIAADGSTGLNSLMLAAVKQKLAESAKLSWELGTRSQTLLELDTPSISVFNRNVPPSRDAPESLSDVIAIARDIVQHKPSGKLPLMQDGSAADPASNGVGVLIANWTGASGGNYGQAAADQLTFLLNVAPKTFSGAISHRAGETQLWSDFIYMVPPFLAYYGALTNNRSLLDEACNQISLYRDVLVDNTGMWQHIRMGSFEDTGHWSTGNGWAAMGMLRVLATIQGSQWAKGMKDQTHNLESWIKEIHNGMWPHLTSDGLFYNYADDASTFPDAASAALLAASTYRFSLISGVHTHLPSAERVHAALSVVGTTNLSRITPDGWLNPVVNPHSFHDQGSESPEAQAFVLQMHAAWRDWVVDGSKGANAAKRVYGEQLGVWVIGAVATMLMVMI